jgi:4-amino-4-deoxy-L-arabinose transferase-like glycosyltransferase
LAAFVFLPGVLSQRDFTISDEARYAEVMREMRDDGHWLVPYLNGSFYPDKPPVFFWLALAAGRVTGGLNPHAGTLVAVLSALGLLAVTWWMGRHAHGDRAGVASACVLLGFVVFLLCAQVVRMDMTMALLVALSMASIQAGLGANRWGYFASHVAAGLAVLVKGPLGLLFPLVAALAVFARRRAWTEMRRYLLNPGLLVAAVLVGGWLAVAWGTGEHEFVRNLFVKQVAGRAVRDGAHGQPVWFFLALLPVLLLPWSPLLAHALWRRRGTWTTGDGLFWAWFLGGLATISVLHGKLFIYILPLLPAIALLVGPWLAQLWDSATAGRPPSSADRAALASSAILTFGLLAAVAAAFPAAVRRGWVSSAFSGVVVWPLAAWCGVCLLLGLLWSVRARIRCALAAILVGACGLPALIFGVVFPSVNDLVSSRPIGDDIRGLRGAGWTVATCAFRGDSRGIVSFYAGGVVPDIGRDELRDWLAQPRRAALLTQKDYHRNRDWLDAIADVRSRRFMVDRDFYLVASRSAEP